MAQKKPTLVIYRATRLPSTVWRAVGSIPPTERDFYSYADLGREVPTADYLRLTSVSMFLTKEGLELVRDKYGLPAEEVELDLRGDKRVTYAVTNVGTGHIEVWAPPDVLLGYVV
jgi:hypothetical protein